MNVFELTRALVDIESITGNEERVGQLPLRLPGAAGRAVRRHAWSAWRWSRAASTCWRGGASPVGHALDAHRHRAAVLPLARGRRVHLGARRLRHQGHHRLHDQGRRSAARSGRARFRAAVRGGRGAQQRRRLPGRAASRADRATSSTASPPKTSWRSAPRARCATRSTAAGRMAHSAYPELGESAIHEAARRAGAHPAHPAAGGRSARAEHAEHRHASPAAARPT